MMVEKLANVMADAKVALKDNDWAFVTEKNMDATRVVQTGSGTDH